MGNISVINGKDVENEHKVNIDQEDQKNIVDSFVLLQGKKIVETFSALQKKVINSMDSLNN